MSIEIIGINSLLNKLNRLSNIKTKEAVDSVAKVVETTIKSGASWAPNASQYIGRCDVREYENGSYFVEIGLKNDNAPFELWKNVYFHNYGYNLKYYGHPTNTFVNTHIMWFNNSVNNVGEPTIEKLKSNIRRQIKACLED